MAGPGGLRDWSCLTPYWLSITVQPVEIPFATF